jgi:hypothetical protein
MLKCSGSALNIEIPDRVAQNKENANCWIQLPSPFKRSSYIAAYPGIYDIIAFPAIVALNEPPDTAILVPNAKALVSSVRTG